MSAEDKAYIETKSIGTIRVVRVDMSMRMRHNFKPKQNEPTKYQDVKNEQMMEDETNDLLQQIQAKRDSIFMEHEVEQGNVIKRVSSLNQNDERIPKFKRHLVQESEEIPLVEREEEHFNWDEQAYWDPPENEVVDAYHHAPLNEVMQEMVEQRDDIYGRDSVKPQTNSEEYWEESSISKLLDEGQKSVNSRNELKQYIDELQMIYQNEEMKEQSEFHIEKEKGEAIKFIIYTILIIIIDILLILLLHSKASLFGESDLNDITRYICIFIKYAVVVHLLVTIYSIYKDKKLKGRKLYVS